MHPALDQTREQPFQTQPGIRGTPLRSVRAHQHLAKCKHTHIQEYGASIGRVRLSFTPEKLEVHVGEMAAIPHVRRVGARQVDAVDRTGYCRERDASRDVRTTRIHAVATSETLQRLTTAGHFKLSLPSTMSGRTPAYEPATPIAEPPSSPRPEVLPQSLIAHRTSNIRGTPGKHAPPFLV